MSETEVLLVSSGNGPGECRKAVGHLLSWLSYRAEQQGVDLDVVTRDGQHGPASAVVILNGSGAGALARDIVGVVLGAVKVSFVPATGAKTGLWKSSACQLYPTTCRSIQKLLRCRPSVREDPEGSIKTKHQVRSERAGPTHMGRSILSLCATTGLNIRTGVWRWGALPR